MYLTGPALQATLEQKYPRRFKLVDDYFRKLVTMVAG